MWNVGYGFRGNIVLDFTRNFPTKYHFLKAPPEEIKREDDVLLQGTPFISAILFFYVNMLMPDGNNKLIIAFAIAVSTGTFYVLRARAKIKSDAKYRFWSVYFLIFLCASFIYEIIAITYPLYAHFLLTTPVLFQILLVSSLAIIPIFSLALATSYFPYRYGVERKRKR